MLHDHYDKYYKFEDSDGHNDIEAAIKNVSKDLTGRYEIAFGRLTTRLKQFGYPQGQSKPNMKVKAELTAAAIYKDNTRIYYAAESLSAKSTLPSFELPEKYNGLGYKNLIYIVLQLESFRAELDAMETNRPRVHVILIEEPEAHPSSANAVRVY